MDNERKPTRDAEGSIIKKTVARRTTNGRTRNVTIYFARVRMNEYNDLGELVKQHERKRTCDTYQEAVDERRNLRNEILADIERNKSRQEPKKLKYFSELLDFFESKYVKPAKFVGSKKTEGQKSPVRHSMRMIKSFREFFGNPPVVSIDYSRLCDYKEFMLATPYMRKRKILLEPEDKRFRGEIVTRYRQRFGILEEYHERKPATVHRYLSCLRTVFSKGVQHGYLNQNPFKQGDPLIIASIEEVRDRICNYEEERDILAVCVPPREHLRDAVICAIDTFMRENELFSLLGSDVNFDDRFVKIVEYNAKTSKERFVPLSDRAIQAFRRLKADRSDAEWNNSRVFEFASVSRAWYTALKKANIENLRWHDLRGTGITRMVDAGVPIPIIMQFSGHDKYETFKKYVKKDLSIIQNAAAAMSSIYRENQIQITKGHLPLGANGETPAESGSEVVIESDAVN